MFAGKSASSGNEDAVAEEADVCGTASAEQISILHRFHFDATEEWFVRFGLSETQNVLAVGSGRAHVVAFDWSSAASPSDTLVSLIPLPQRTAAIVRQALIVGAQDELLVAACDTGTLHFFVKDFRTPPRADPPAVSTAPLTVRTTSTPSGAPEPSNGVTRAQHSS